MDTSNLHRKPVTMRAKRICKIVASGATKEQWAEWLRVPLEHAAAAGNAELFHEILEAGANVSAGWSGCGGRSLLEAATRGGSVGVVSAVLEAGVQPDVDLALHIACSMGHVAAGRRLIVAGADVNFVHPVHQSTSLHLAVRGGCDLLVHDLLEAGANTSLRQADKYRRAPLHIAAGEGHEGIVSALLWDGADVGVLDAYGNSPLIWAARGGHLAVVETLLTAGADVSVEGGIKEFKASSALGFAAELGHVDIMKAIIGAGADVNAGIHPLLRAGFPALHCAARRDQVGAIDMLIEAGAKVDSLDRKGMTPLLRAAARSQFGAMGRLLEHGAAVNTKGGRGDTALHMICRSRYHGFDTAVSHLLVKGADDMALNDDGQIPEEFLYFEVPIYPVIPARRREELRRAKVLLARAPADREWRRRGWIVVLRARVENERALKRRKVGGRDVAPFSRNGGAGASASDGRCAGVVDEEMGGGLRGVVDMLVKRAPEGVFRTVFEFL